MKPTRISTYDIQQQRTFKCPKCNLNCVCIKELHELKSCIMLNREPHKRIKTYAKTPFDELQRFDESIVSIIRENPEISLYGVYRKVKGHARTLTGNRIAGLMRKNRVRNVGTVFKFKLVVNDD